MQLNQLLAAPGFGAWLEGEALDIDRLLYAPNGRPRVSVISIAHLDDQERMFFVSLLLNEIVGWMRSQRGTSSLRALVYFDEIFGFLPPVANPPSKAPLLTLLKQARAFGLGLVVATQNPVDLDYKALSNAGTWMLGRLQTDRDKARVLDGLEGAAVGSGAGFDRARNRSPAVGARQAAVPAAQRPRKGARSLFETRWTLSYLRGPLGRDEIKRLSPPAGGGAPAQAVPGRGAPTGWCRCRTASKSAGSAATPTASASVAPGARESRTPVIDPSIKQFFLPGAEGDELEPSLLGVARISYTDAKLGIDETRDVAVVTPIADGAVAVDWDHAEPADFEVRQLQQAPPAGATFGPLPAAAAKPRSYATWEKDFARWAASSQSIEVFRSARTKLSSAPDESERDFRIRLQQTLREGRDQALARVREKHASRLRTAEDKLRRAEAAVERENQQASESKMSAAVSFGATVLGALIGRKAVSATTLGRATTAAKSMGRISRESGDVARASIHGDDARAAAGGCAGGAGVGSAGGAGRMGSAGRRTGAAGREAEARQRLGAARRTGLAGEVGPVSGIRYPVVPGPVRGRGRVRLGSWVLGLGSWVSALSPSPLSGVFRRRATRQRVELKAHSCRSGGTGRRAGLKIPFRKGCVGSIPSSGTNGINTLHRFSERLRCLRETL